MAGVPFPAEPRIFLYSTKPRSPYNRWIPGVLSPEVKLSGREADCSTSSSAWVKNGGAISPLPHAFSWSNAQLMKHSDNIVLQAETF
jgi:hypothetical protein